MRALEEFFVGGIKTNAGLFRRILADEDFQSGRIDTGYLERCWELQLVPKQQEKMSRLSRRRYLR